MLKNQRSCKKEQQQLFCKLTIVTLMLFVAATGFYCSKDKETKYRDYDSLSSSQLLQDIGVSRGICVVLGDSLCELSRALSSQSELIIYTQFSNQDNVDAAREIIDAAGLYGTRIYVEKGDLAKIHLADNIADAVIAMGDATHIPKDEILRVLRPEGVALVGSKKFIKPFPEGIDDWSHPYHGPDNNTQSNDQLIKAPYLTQFISDPRYAPATQVSVASAGRIFKAFGNVAFHEREEPYLNTLVAFNGYNGTILWKKDLVPGMMVHRNTMIATPSTLYLADDISCKLIDSRTGRIKDEIIPPVDKSGGTFWKWMAMENGILYALIGEQEQKDAVMRWRRTIHGWPWNGISEGFTQEDNPWGFGHNILAIDPEKKKILWHYQEKEKIDSRAICMKNNCIYLFRFDSYLTCLNAKTGKIIWRKTKESNPDLFQILGHDLNRQGYVTNWRTTDYVMCSDDALYFAGPQVQKLIAVSTKDGSVLWQNDFNNFQLVLREDGLYAISGPWNNNVSKIFNPLTGEILADLPAGRRACTRPNGSADAIFYRAKGGTVRLDIQEKEQHWISPMRPPCHDGVTISNGMLYWGPYVCDCQLTMYGMIGLGPAGDYDFNQKATKSERLDIYDNRVEKTSLLHSTSDWPTFRQSNNGFVSTDAIISNNSQRLWRYPEGILLHQGTDILGHAFYNQPTAPITVDGLVFWSGTDGIVKCLDVLSGELIWKAFTGGAVRFPPTVWKDRLLVASGDGYVYNYNARTGTLKWRFRVAPQERKIPVYGSLLSTWPAASGVLVKDGVAYVAAGIVNYDGTHIYALDADSGDIIWQNNNSGHLLPNARTGVSVQGHMLIKKDKLYLASGTSLSPAIYDIKSGTCLNDPEPLKNCESTSPRGCELYLVGDNVVASGKPFYSHPEHDVYDASVLNKMLHSPNGKRDILWVNQSKIYCYPSLDKQLLNKCSGERGFMGYTPSIWSRFDNAQKAIWEVDCEESVALAVCENAVIIAKKTQLIVLDISDGKQKWSQTLDYPPVPWGLTVSRNGQIVVTLVDGSIQCFGEKSSTLMPYISSDNSYFSESAVVKMACDQKNALIRYTIDGSDPTEESDVYKKPFTITNPATVKMRAFQKNFPDGYVVSQEFKKVDYNKAREPEKARAGLAYNYYEGYCNTVSDLDQMEPVKSGIIMDFKLQPREGVNVFGYHYSGFILIPRDGVYTFYSKSNDGSVLYINGKELINNDGAHGTYERFDQIELNAGEYPFMFKYFQQGGGKYLKVSWRGPDFPKQELTADVLFHKISK